MCWIGNKAHRKIAKEDIKCKKIISLDFKANFYTPYYRMDDMVYELGKLYSCNTLSIGAVDKKGNIRISRGFHCYGKYVAVCRPNALSEIGTQYDYLVHMIGKPYQGYWRNSTRKPILVECTIPSGSIYYENEDGEIVSDHLRIDREITL